MFRESIRILKQDKIILLCSLFPIIIGLILYYFLGSWVYHDVLQAGKEYLESKTQGWAGALSYVLGGLLIIGFYFLVNWTFVLVVSLVSAPLNDLISHRTQILKEGHQELPSASNSFRRMMTNFFGMMFNEIKKVSLIIFLSLIAFAASFIFPPLGYLLSALLVAISFVDYSWSRNDLSFKGCLVDYKNGVFRYTIGGGIFTILFGIPIVNLFSYPIAVIYFTLGYIKVNNKES